MPFTLSHAVAVLPLATGRSGRRLVPAALVIGSWVPDLPYFVPLPVSSRLTHAAGAPVTVDLLLGLVVLALWELLLRRPLADLAPERLRSRLPQRTPFDGRRALAAAGSVVLGAATHVLWDTFTHHDRWGTSHLAPLTAELGPLPVFTWFQFASGGLGLAGLGLWLLLWARRTAPRPAPSSTGTRLRTAVLGLVVLAGLVTTLLTLLREHAAGSTLEAALVGAVTATISVTGAVVVGLCVLWHLAPGRPGASSGGRLRHAGRVGERPTEGGQR